MKLIAWLYENGQRCQMCGTADWEWEDPYAFIAGVEVCKGCAMKDNARDMAKDVAGGTIVLLSGEAKKKELAKQRDAYLASKTRDEDGG